MRRTVLLQLAGSARGFCGPGSPFTTCLSKKSMQIPAHAAQIPDQNAVLVLAHQKGSCADILSVTPQFEGLHSNAGLWGRAVSVGSQGCGGTAALLLHSSCHCCVLICMAL